MLIDSLNPTPSADGSSTAAAADASLQEDLNRFLTLLVTQLQHQDPLEPMDANQFTQQLVQFAGVEQQIQQNANLEKLVAAEHNAQAAAMVSYLGHRVEVTGDVLPLQDGFAEARYTLADNVRKTAVFVKDRSGDVVYAAPGSSEAGRHAFTWDGQNADGVPLPDGTYTMEVVATRPDGTFAEVAQTAYGRVSSAAVDGGSVQLFLGDIAVTMDDVRSVSEPLRAPATEDD